MADENRLLTRRYFFGKTSAGLGIAALSGLLHADDGGLPGLPPLRTYREACHLPLSIGRAVADGPLRLQTPSPGVGQTGAARIDPYGTATHRHDVDTNQFPGRAVSVPVSPARQFRSLGQRAYAASGKGVGRTVLHQVDVHRGDQSRSRSDILPDRVPASRAPLDRGVAGVWIRQCK